MTGCWRVGRRNPYAIWWQPGVEPSDTDDVFVGSGRTTWAVERLVEMANAGLAAVERDDTERGGS